MGGGVGRDPRGHGDGVGQWGDGGMGWEGGWERHWDGVIVGMGTAWGYYGAGNGDMGLPWGYCGVGDIAELWGYHRDGDILGPSWGYHGDEDGDVGLSWGWGRHGVIMGMGMGTWGHHGDGDIPGPWGHHGVIVGLGTLWGYYGDGDIPGMWGHFGDGDTETSWSYHRGGDMGPSWGYCGVWDGDNGDVGPPSAILGAMVEVWGWGWDGHRMGASWGHQRAMGAARGGGASLGCGDVPPPPPQGSALHWGHS